MMSPQEEMLARSAYAPEGEELTSEEKSVLIHETKQQKKRERLYALYWVLALPAMVVSIIIMSLGISSRPPDEENLTPFRDAFLDSQSSWGKLFFLLVFLAVVVVQLLRFFRFRQRVHSKLWGTVLLVLLSAGLQLLALGFTIRMVVFK